MAALHDLCWDFLFSSQMICKQHIVLNHVFFQYESNLEPVTVIPKIICKYVPELVPKGSPEVVTKVTPKAVL